VTAQELALKLAGLCDRLQRLMQKDAAVVERLGLDCALRACMDDLAEASATAAVAGLGQLVGA